MISRNNAVYIRHDRIPNRAEYVRRICGWRDRWVAIVGIPAAVGVVVCQLMGWI